MRYDNLHNFIQDLSACNGCGNDLKIALVDGQKRSRNFLSKYIYDNQNLLKGTQEFNWEWVNRFVNVVYLCKAKGDDLILFSLNRDGFETTLLTVNTKTGKVKEDVEYAQAIIWKHKVGAYKYCAYDYCSCTYFAEVSPFCLERKENKIFNVTVAFEGYMLNLSDNSYILTNSKEFPKITRLIQHDKSIFQDFEVVKDVPLIDFKTIKHQTLVNKVKTILTFS